MFTLADKLNILAFRGRRDKVMEEANKIAKFLNIPVKDLIPREPDGSIKDDDYNSFSIEPIEVFFVIIGVVILLSIIVTILS